MKIQKKIYLIAMVLTMFVGMKMQVQAADAKSSDEIMNIAVQVEYRQETAREMYQAINEFRQEQGLWYWNEGNTEKIAVSGLKPYEYNYELEKLAMQRAAEIALSFSHERPNGTSIRDLNTSNYRAENIAAGRTTVQRTMEDLREDSQGYAGQGHRRTMLSKDYTAVGCGHVVYGGIHYWVQEYLDDKGAISETVAYEGLKTVQVEILCSKVSQVALEEELGYIMAQGESAQVPTVVSANVTIASHATKTPCFVQVPVEWTSEDESVAIVEDGYVKAVTSGKTNLVCEVFDQKIVAPVDITCQHELVTMEAVAPTCEDAGRTEGSYCSKCGKVQVLQKTIEALGHDTEIDQGTPATCENPGVSDGSHCKRCKKVLVSQKVLAALGHDVTMEEAVEPTCEEAGHTEGIVCSRCDKVYKEFTTIKALGHERVNVPEKKPTCQEEGLTAGVQCSRCKKMLVEQKSIDKLEHVMVVDEGMKPTCEKDGIKAGVHCDVCKEVLVPQEVISKLEHEIIEDEAVEAGCEKNGKTQGSHCDLCGKVFEESKVVKALGHDWDEGSVLKPYTETEVGTLKYSCKRCEKTKYTIIPASEAPIDLEDAQLVLNMEQVDGSYTFDMDVSTGETQPKVVAIMIDGKELDPSCYSVAIEMAGIGEAAQLVVEAALNCEGSVSVEFDVVCEHEKEIIPEVLATCEKDGLTAGEHCRKCGTIYTKQETMKALGHKWDKGVVKKPATVEQNGEMEYTCTVCKKTKKEIIDKLSGSNSGSSSQDKPGSTTGGDNGSQSSDSKNPTITNPGGNTTNSDSSNSSNSNDNNSSNSDGSNSSNSDGSNSSNSGNNSNAEQNGASEFAYVSSKPVKKGQTITMKSGVAFKILASGGKANEVEYKKPSKGAKAVTVPDTITVNGKAYKVTCIGNNAFKNNKSLTSVTIGKNITKIGKNAFNGCKKLKKIKIKSKKIKKIGAHAFKKIHKKAKFKYPSSKKKAYKKMLKKALK